MSLGLELIRFTVTQPVKLKNLFYESFGYNPNLMITDTWIKWEERLTIENNVVSCRTFTSSPLLNESA